MNSLTKQVKTNLEYYNLWTKVQVIDLPQIGTQVLNGIPPDKLHSEDLESQVEWVVPHDIDPTTAIPLDTINCWFEGIELVTHSRPKRITIGLINDDSTIVFYFIHDGIVKPRQN